jgi:hypothetical protein
MDHRIHEFPITQSIAFARVRQQVRRIGHAFHSTGYDDFRVAGEDALNGKTYRFQSRAAYFVDRQCGNFGAKTAAERSLSGGVLTEAGRKDITQDHFVDLFRRESRSLDCSTDHEASQLRSGQGFERTLKLADRGTNGAEDDGVSHKIAPE